MQKYVLGLLVCLVMMSLSVSAQRREQNDVVFTRSRRTLEPLPFHFGGLISGRFYGFKLGVDYPLKMTEIRGFMGGFMGQRVIYEQYLSADAGLWHWQGIHENAFISTEWMIRIISNRGYFWQISPLGVGGSYLLPSFFKQKITQDSLPATDRFYVTPSVSIGIGRDFAFRRGHLSKPFVIYLKAGVSSILPFKKLGFIYPTLETGLAARFDRINVFVKKVRRD